MAERKRVLIVGGTGIFGRLLAAELLETTDADLALTSRRMRAAEKACDALGDRAMPMPLDLANPDEFADAAHDFHTVVCTAGPFRDLPPDLPLDALRAGAHWVDIADDSGWVLPLLADASLDARARDAGLSVVPGLSTVPALSGALARWAHELLPSASNARVTLYIGNRNSKGTAAIASALAAGFRDPIRVDLPVGRRRAYKFRSPDSALFRRELGITTEFRVALEWGPAGRVIAGAGRLWARLGDSARASLARALSATALPFGRFGEEGGCVQVEEWDDEGRRVTVSILGDQRMAILPCAFAVEDLLAGRRDVAGVRSPADWLSPVEWTKRLRGRGVHVLSHTEPAYGDEGN